MIQASGSWRSLDWCLAYCTNHASREMPDLLALLSAGLTTPVHRRVEQHQAGARD
jgi:hypothetical protein